MVKLWCSTPYEPLSSGRWEEGKQRQRQKNRGGKGSVKYRMWLIPPNQTTTATPTTCQPIYWSGYIRLLSSCYSCSMLAQEKCPAHPTAKDIENGRQGTSPLTDNVRAARDPCTSNPCMFMCFLNTTIVSASHRIWQMKCGLQVDIELFISPDTLSVFPLFRALWITGYLI